PIECPVPVQHTTLILKVLQQVLVCSLRLRHLRGRYGCRVARRTQVRGSPGLNLQIDGLSVKTAIVEILFIPRFGPQQPGGKAAQCRLAQARHGRLHDVRGRLGAVVLAHLGQEFEMHVSLRMANGGFQENSGFIYQMSRAVRTRGPDAILLDRAYRIPAEPSAARPPTIGIENDECARSTVSCVPGFGQSVNSRSLDMIITASRFPGGTNSSSGSRSNVRS